MINFESSESAHPRMSVLEIKEGEPRVHTVYAYLSDEWKGKGGRTDEVLAIYTDKEDALKSARLGNMFAGEDDRIVPLQVYERLEDLPEEIRNEIHGEDSSLPMEKIEEEDGTVYAVMPNTDSTEGRGNSYIWTLAIGVELAYQIARMNGPSGSDAKVIKIPLNRQLKEEDTVFGGINIKR